MSKSEQERLEDLEILAAHQARTIDDLNEVVVQQGRTIADLRRRIEGLSGQLDDLADSIGPNVPVDKPPHW